MVLLKNVCITLHTYGMHTESEWVHVTLETILVCSLDLAGRC